MKALPLTNRSPLLRAAFDNDQAWIRLCEAIQEPSEEGFIAYFDYISDPSYSGLTVERLTDIVLDDEKHSFICVADHITLTDSEQLILVIDCYDQPSRTF